MIGDWRSRCLGILIIEIGGSVKTRKWEISSDAVGHLGLFEGGRSRLNSCCPVPKPEPLLGVFGPCRDPYSHRCASAGTKAARALSLTPCPERSTARVSASPALSAAPLPTPALVAIFDACIRDAERALITDRNYLARLGVETKPCTAGELWAGLFEILTRAEMLAPQWLPPLHFISRRGTLARRIASALGSEAGQLHSVYRELCECLRDDRMFAAGALPA